MATIFATIPESFDGSAGTRQRNAIRSWCLLTPEPRIIFTGIDDDSVQWYADSMCIEAVEIDRSPEGIPLVSAALRTAYEMRDNEDDILCLVNADGIYTRSVLLAINKVADEFDQFLMVGQRWDLKLDRHLSFLPGWERALTKVAFEHGAKHGDRAMDYLIFRGGWPLDMPDFAVGRTAYDNWMVFKARQEGVPVVNASQDVTLIHQDHEDLRKKKRRQPATRRNRELLWAQTDECWGIGNATHILSNGRLICLS